MKETDARVWMSCRMVAVVAGDVGEAAGAEEEGLMTIVGVEVARETQAGVVGAEEAEEA
jgi:hypothetical protein